MANIQPTVDHIGDDTLTRELRNLASQVDKNETALNQEMASISEAQQEVDQKIAGFQDAIDQNTQDITTLKGNIQTIEQDLSTIEQKNTEQDTAIDQNETAIQNEVTARQNAITAEQTAREDGDVTGVDLSYNSGAIAIQLTREEGNMQDSVTCPFIKTATLVPTSTERAFKIQFEFQDGTQYDTNEFLIPEGGGTEVSVTGVTVVDGTAPDSFQVQIQLSDGEPLKSNDYTIDFPAQVNTYPTAVNMSLSGTTLNVTIVLNNGTNVQGTANLSGLLTGYATTAQVTEIQSDLQEQITGLHLSKSSNNQIQLNGEFVNVIDNVTPQIVDGNTLRVEVNGVVGQVAIPSGDEWEEISINTWPSDFTEDDELLITIGWEKMTSTLPSSWDEKPLTSQAITYSTQNNITILVGMNTQTQSSSNYILHYENNPSYIWVVYLSLNSVDRLNGSTDTIGGINSNIFNGAGRYGSFTGISKTNWSYIKKIMRKKK